MSNIKMTDLISKLDENFVEDVCWDDTQAANVSVSEIRKKVNAGITIEKRQNHLRFKIAIAVTCIIIMSVPCYAFVIKHLDRAAIVDDSNRHLVGKEVQSDYYIVYDGEYYTDSYGNSVTEIDDLIDDKPASSRLVTDIEAEPLEPSSYSEIRPQNVRGKSTVYPELIMVNNSVCILTKENGSGWELEKGDVIIYGYEKIKSEVVKTQALNIGVIQNGVMKEPIVLRNESGVFTFTAEEDGKYFIYLHSASSDYQTIKEGIIKSDK